MDRWVLRRLDKVVCVSHAQADKVRKAGVADADTVVIHNAVGDEAFVQADAATRDEMIGWFARPPRWLIAAAGRFSPEKGFSVLIDAAAVVLKDRPDAAFVLFGDGPLRPQLETQIAAHGIGGRFVLGGFRKDIARFLPNADIAVMSSFTEGLPVILLETGAAGVPCVATAVGGIPEVVDDGRTGFLVPAGAAATLAERIVTLLDDEPLRLAVGRAAQARVRSEFSFASMAQRYLDVFRGVTGTQDQVAKACSL
jgi:glycosyltransferase involved in cell wall biosynthesis